MAKSPNDEWHPNNAELWGALTTIQHGFDPDVALRVARYFFQRLEDDLNFNERAFSRYIWHALGLIVAGHSANAAFGFSRKRKRPVAHDIDRQMALAASVILCMKNAPESVTGRWEHAIGETANLFFKDGTGDRAIAAAYARYKKVFSHFNFTDDELQEIVDAAMTTVK